MSQYEDAVRKALTAHSSLGELALSVADDADLHALGLSSLETVRVILAVEAILGIEYPESAIDRSVTSTISGIACACGIASTEGLN